MTKRYAVPVGGGVIIAKVRRFMRGNDYLTVLIGGGGVATLPLNASASEQRKAMRAGMDAALQHRVDELKRQLREYERVLADWRADPELFATTGDDE